MGQITETTLEIAAVGGPMNVFVARPSGLGPFAPVVIYMDFWGIREELREIARRVARAGYLSILPDFYYREGAVRHQYRTPEGKMMPVTRLAPEQLELVAGPMNRLTDSMVVSDTNALLNFIESLEYASHDAVGSIGYCMGGRHVLAVAGHYPDRFRANACLHGTDVVSEKPDSPHKKADRFRGELYAGFAENDRYCPPEAIRALGDALINSAVEYHFNLHAGAAHGYALPDCEVYDEHAAETDWILIFAMFERQLSIPR